MQVSLSLGDLLGTSNLGLLPSTGALCPSGTAPAASSTGTSGVAPTTGTPLDGLLGTVNSLLSGAWPVDPAAHLGGWRHAPARWLLSARS